MAKGTGANKDAMTSKAQRSQLKSSTSRMMSGSEQGGKGKIIPPGGKVEK